MSRTAPPARRRVLLAAGAALAGLGLWRAWPEQGLRNPCLGPLPPQLAQHPLLRQAWAGLDAGQVWDMHVHLFPLAAGHEHGQGVLWEALGAVQRQFFRNAACVGDAVDDAVYAARLGELAGALPAGAKLLLLALDACYDEQGRARPERTHVQVGNDACAAAAAALPTRFEWAASVHPYRADAVVAVEQARAQGARALKWIPAAQGIDPASPRCDAVYRTLARLDLPLICHAGSERAAPGDDALGNPLRLRRALGQGVRVVVAHCATMGQSRDLDRGEAGPWIDNFALFERLMEEPASRDLLFGDLAAVTQSARVGPALARIVERASEGGDWAGRLLNGSDYPLPAIMPLYSLRALVDLDLLEAAALPPLTAIRRHNALLFDFALKRALRYRGKALAARVFETRRFFARA